MSADGRRIARGTTKCHVPSMTWHPARNSSSRMPGTMVVRALHLMDAAHDRGVGEVHQGRRSARGCMRMPVISMGCHAPSDSKEGHHGE